MSFFPSGPTRSAPSARQRVRRVTALTGALATGLLLAACSSSSSTSSAAAGTSGSADPSASGSVNLSDVTLTFGFQTADNPALLKASGLFNNLPYKLSTPVISGPANQIAALNSKAIDAGLVGENTAAFQDANSATAWTASTAQVYEVAGYSAGPNAPYASGLYVTTKSGINSLAGLKGHSIAYNFGGNIYAAYVKALSQGGLTISQITPEQFTDNQSAANAFAAGHADAVVTSYADIAPQVESGQAKLLDTLPQLGVKGGAGFITRPDVLADPGQVAALKDFFSRLSKLYSQWYPTHEAAVEQIYQTVDHQSPAVAKITYASTAPTRFYKIGDPTFVHNEQLIVDGAYQAKGVKNDYNTAVVFNPIFDPETVPSS
jgi:sulfonate transport system substrate-binding protein